MKMVLFVCLVLFCLPAMVQGEDKPAKKTSPVLNFTMKGLDGKSVNLADFQGKVVVFVNVASECGYTPQYKGLQELHTKYSKEGLVVVGVPANEFGGQEPGSNEDIAKFCASNYSVTFPMLAKVVVEGKDQCDLYKFLTSKETNPKFGGEVKWNFTKFVIGRNGEIVKRYEPGVKPQDMAKELEDELKK